MTPFAWILLIVCGLATVYAGYVAYPFVEEPVLRHIRSYLDWAVLTREKMFRPIPRKRLALAIFSSGFLFATLGFVISRGNGIITLFFTGGFAALGWMAVRIWINFGWKRRIRKFDEQLVDGLNLLANSLKSGLNLNQAIQVLVKEMPNPLAQEFGLVLSQEKLGLTTDEALERMLERIPSEDLAVAIHSILILRETGGDLSETFETIATTIRERRRVDGKIQGMTAQGKMQGIVLFLLPFGFMGALYLINPEYIGVLFTTQLGWMMLTAMLFLQIIGGLWLKKIVTIDI
jgi:tight adherence protein B